MNRYAVRILDPRQDPEPGDYAAFARSAQLFASWDYRLTALESRSARNPAVIATVREDGVLLAVLCATLCRPARGRRAPRQLGGRARWAPRWVEVGQPWLTGLPGWAFAENLEPARMREVLRAFERSICRYTGPGCLGVLYRSVPADLTALVGGHGRLVRAALPNLVLDNTFTSVDEWVAGLGRKRRSSLRAQLRRVAADPDLVVRCAPGREDLDVPGMVDMWRAHRARLGPVPFDSRSALSMAYLEELVRRPDVYTLTYSDRDGRLLAYTIIQDGSSAVFAQHWATLDRADGGRPDLYFDTYMRCVQRMVEGNRKWLAVGRGMAELKQSLGFRPRPLAVAVVPRVVAG